MMKTEPKTNPDLLAFRCVYKPGCLPPEDRALCAEAVAMDPHYGSDPDTLAAGRAASISLEAHAKHWKEIQRRERRENPLQWLRFQPMIIMMWFIGLGFRIWMWVTRKIGVSSE